MTFQEIFKEKGLYRADSFADGVAFKIYEAPMLGGLQLTTVEYKSPNDLFPLEYCPLIYSGLFEKDYKKVLTINSLFLKQ